MAELAVTAFGLLRSPHLLPASQLTVATEGMTVGVGQEAGLPSLEQS